jgi:Arc/MetJ-type ribon-helix-helix transcriptional regulator
LTQKQKLVNKENTGYGKTVIFSVSLPEEIVEEVEKRRRYDSRSRYILRAVDHYLNAHNDDEEKYCTAGEEQESMGVRPSTKSNPTTYTSTSYSTKLTPPVTEGKFNC